MTSDVLMADALDLISHASTPWLAGVKLRQCYDARSANRRQLQQYGRKMARRLYSRPSVSCLFLRRNLIHGAHLQRLMEEIESS